MIEDKKLYTKTELKELFNLTETMITKIPIKATKPNSFYKSKSPIKLYDIKDIQIFLSSEEYKVMKEKSEKRRQGARKAVQTKKESTDKLVDELLKTIKVKVISKKELLRQTLEAKSDWYYQNNPFSIPGVNTVDEATKARWIVNYIRHNLTEYDEYLDCIIGKVGNSEAYYRINNYIMDQIAKRYPQYIEEIERQKQSKLE